MSKSYFQSFSLFLLFTLCLVLLVSCGGGGESSTSKNIDPVTPVDTSYLSSPSANSERKWLTVDELQGATTTNNSPYHNGYFSPLGEAAQALHTFNGTITIEEGTISGFPSQFDDNFNADKFPAVTIDFASHNGFLVPAVRDIIVTSGINGNSDKQWRVIFSPGKVWSESTDNGYSRGSFPFTLVERSWNNALNGLATFAYDDSQISKIRIQIVQHTSSGFINEGAALLNATYDNTPISNKDDITGSFDTELANLIPVKSWQTLIESYAEGDFSQFNSGLAQQDVSAGAIYLDGVIYQQACATKFGDYPYCQFMRHGIYSATKSAAASVALAFLVEKYGENVSDSKLLALLDTEVTHEGWNDVTLIDLLNMAAGIGNNDDNPDSPNNQPDESAPPMGDWTRTKSAKNKTRIAIQQYGNYPWQPGEVFRYNTTHTFLAAAVMDQIARQNENKGLWQLMLEEVFHSIGIAHLPMMHTTEHDGSTGIPIFGIGLYPTVDEIVKISLLLHNHGRYQGQQILNAMFTDNMLFRQNDVGLPAHSADSEFGGGKYHRSYWGTPFIKDNCDVYVPFMKGNGGNLVGIFPSGVIAVRFSDADQYDVLGIIDTLGSINKVCAD